MLPTEVIDRVRSFFRLDAVDPARVEYALQADISKAAAWQRLLDKCPWDMKVSNPFRKCHSANYWIWYRKHEAAS